MGGLRLSSSSLEGGRGRSIVDLPEGEVGGKRVVVEERAMGRGEMRWG